MNAPSTAKSSTRSPDTPDTPDTGNTRVQQDGEHAPRLPHERDESSDSHRAPDGPPSEVGRQAHSDVKRGVVDTDRGPVLDKINKEHFKPAPEEDEDADPVG